MCGRFTLTTADYDAVAAALEAEIDPDASARYRPRFNVAPTDPHPMLVAGHGPVGETRVDGGPRRLVWGTWGIVPPPRPGAKSGLQINARAEGITRGYIGTAFARHRCAIVADGFYEWTGPKNDRRPIRFTPKAGGLLVFAGVWLPQKDKKSGEQGPHFAILTTEANELVRSVHDRMPVILTDVDTWLQPGDAPERLESLRTLLRPAPDDALVATPVSPRVNDVKNDDADCLTPALDPNPLLPGL